MWNSLKRKRGQSENFLLRDLIFAELNSSDNIITVALHSKEINLLFKNPVVCVYIENLHNYFTSFKEK